MAGPDPTVPPGQPPARQAPAEAGGPAGQGGATGPTTPSADGGPGTPAGRRSWLGRSRTVLHDRLVAATHTAASAADDAPPAGATDGSWVRDPAHPPGAASAVALGAVPDQRPAQVEVSLHLPRLRRATIAVLLIITLWMVAVWIYGAIGHFLFLLLLAWLIAIAMEPMIGFLVRRRWKRGLATAVTGTAGLLVGLGLIAVFGSEFVTQLIVLVQTLPETVTGAVTWTNETFGTNLSPDRIIADLQITPQRVAEWASGLAGGVLGVFGSFVAIVFDLVTVAVFSLYFAAAGPRVLQTMAGWMPPERQRVIGTVWEIAAAKTGGYVVSKVVLAGLSAVFHSVFFWIIGLDSFLPMGLLVGILAQFVPVVGTYIGVAIPMLLAVFEDPRMAVYILIFSTIYQQIETYVFTPRVSKRTMDVNPAVALGAVFVGAAIWGPIGALIGIPLAAAVVAVMQTYGRRYEVVDELAAVEAAPEPDEPPRVAREAPKDSSVSRFGEREVVPADRHDGGPEGGGATTERSEPVRSEPGS